MLSETYYQVLEVSKNATTAEIRDSYRNLSRKYHPDKNLEFAHCANEKMQEVNMAFTVLSNPVSRKKYDLSLKRQSGVVPISVVSQQHRSKTPIPSRRAEMLATEESDPPRFLLASRNEILSIYTQLTSWCKVKAKEEGVPSFLIFSPKELQLISCNAPWNKSAVVSIRGLGLRASTYGSCITEIVRQILEGSRRKFDQREFQSSPLYDSAPNNLFC